MKRITCEVCGSTDIKKEDNVYVCECCGCKYSIEEMRKLLVEGEITINENHNYNINHAVSGKVEIVEKDNTVEEINKIIESYNREVKYAKNSKERLSAWKKHFSLFQEKDFVLNHPELVETWLGVLYLQTMAFTFDREACNVAIRTRLYNIANQGIDKETDDESIDFYDEWGGEYTYNYINENMDNIVTYANEDYLNPEKAHLFTYTFYTNQEIFEHLKEILANGNATEIQKEKIEDYEERHTELMNSLLEHQKITRSNSSDEGSYSSSSNYSGQSSGGCYIATAVYGSYDCPEVWTLRRYRDWCLAKTWYGRIFIRIYYAISPTLVRWFGNTDWFKGIWRGKLNQMVKRLQKEGYLSTPYEDNDM